MSPKTDIIKDRIIGWEEPYRTIGFRMYDKYHKEFNSLPASKSHHSAFPGGLRSHTLKVMNAVSVLYDAYMKMTYCSTGVGLTFSRDKAECAAFIHDFGKITEGKKDGGPFVNHWLTIFDMLKELEIEIDEEMSVAILHHHGGWGPSGEMNPLAIFIHSADLWASQVLEKEEQ